MGWAARQKQQAYEKGRPVTRGNPEAVRLTMRSIDSQKLREARKLKVQPVAHFSDRSYAIDDAGTLRRLPSPAHRPAVAEASMSVKQDDDKLAAT